MSTIDSSSRVIQALIEQYPIVFHVRFYCVYTHIELIEMQFMNFRGATSMHPTRKEQDMNVVQQLIEQTVHSILYSHPYKFKVRSSADDAMPRW